MGAMGAGQLKAAVAASRARFLAAQLNQATRDVIERGNTLRAQCLSCGAEFPVTGFFPKGSIAVAGECKSTPQGTKIHRPEVWSAMGTRIA
jgi:hypothetical protein